MLRPFRFAVWLVEVAWKVAPAQVGAAALASLVVAAVPSLQVILMSRFVAALTSADEFRDVSAPFVGLVLLIALASPLNDVAGTFQWRTMDQVRLALLTDVADVVATLPAARIATPEVAETIEKGNQAAQDQLPVKYPQTIALAASVLSVVGVLVTLWTMSPLAAALVLLALVPMLLASRRLTIIDSQMWEDLGKLVWRERYLHSHLVGAASARELSSLGGMRRISAMVAQANRAITARKAKTYPPTLAWNIGAGLGTSLLLVAALAALIVGVSYGPAAAGGVFGVIAAMGVVAMFGAYLGQIVEGVAPYDRYQALLDLRAEPSRPVVQQGADVLCVDGLAHTYPGADGPAIEDLDLTIGRGSIVAFVGVNGAGKTTAVDAIVGTIDRTDQKGSVTIDGRTPEEAGRDGWAGYFGLLTQEFGKYELTVRQSLLLGTPREDVEDHEMWAALEAAGAAAMVRRFEHGLDQQLGGQWPDGTGISGGQWQRLSLARIHLRAAPIWILDEPTSAIDAEAEQQIFRELIRSKAGRVTIVVSHRAWTLRDMDEILVFDHGRIVERGRYDDLLLTGGRFAEIFAEQTR